MSARLAPSSRPLPLLFVAFLSLFVFPWLSTCDEARQTQSFPQWSTFSSLLLLFLFPLLPFSSSSSSLFSLNLLRQSCPYSVRRIPLRAFLHVPAGHETGHKMMMTFITQRGESQGKTKKERKATKSKGRGLEEGGPSCRPVGVGR